MTSWEDVGGWYHDIVGSEGHYYHKHVILPKLLPLLQLKEGDHLLDVGCGQGILARALPPKVTYHGIDLSQSLIAKAPKKHGLSYTVSDACEKLPFEDRIFTHATLVLSLQNMQAPDKVIANIGKVLRHDGSLVIVLNHPCFRIPRQSHWQIDEKQKLQYRRINRYLSPLSIPITIQGKETLTFHHSLSDYATYLRQAGFMIETLEEWTSDKISNGRAAKMENFARKEFPLFLTIKSILLHN